MSLTQCQTGRRHFCVYMEFLLLSTPCTVINFYSEYYINTTRRAYHAKNKISGIYFHSHHIRLYDLHHPLHPDLHRLHNSTTDEPARNHRILWLHLKSDLDMDWDHLPELHHGLPTPDPDRRTALPLHLPPPIRHHSPGLRKLTCLNNIKTILFLIISMISYRMVFIFLNEISIITNLISIFIFVKTSQQRFFDA